LLASRPIVRVSSYGSREVSGAPTAPSQSDAAVLERLRAVGYVQ
jgi:hypothetical protein